MADVLAQQISQLLSLDADRQRAAIDCLTMLPAARRCPPAGPPGLWRNPASPAHCSLEPLYLHPELTRPDKGMARSDSFLTDSTADCGSRADSVSDCSDKVSTTCKEEDRPEVTTLKIKNLPRRCTAEEILAAVDEAGHAGTYDFFFLPLGGQQARQNRGYAFINFEDSAIASNFRAIFHRYRIREKYVEVVAAPVQGLEENIERYNQLAQESDEGSAKAIMRLF